MFSQNQVVVVTGGAGFIGSHLVDALLKAHYRVIAFDNLRNGSLENLKNAFTFPTFRFVEGDILNPKDLNAVSGADYVFHLACLGVRHSIHSPFENHRVNAEGTLNVLEVSRTYKVRKFFYISSSEVYGQAQEFPLTEQALPAPLTVYGASKLVGEHYTTAYQDCFGLKTVVLRIFNNYGPRAHYEGDCGEIIPRSIVLALNDQQPIIFGDGSFTRDFIYVEDTVRALVDIIPNDQMCGQTFNIGTGVEIAMKDLLTNILGLMGKESLGFNFMEQRLADVPRLWVNADKFKSLTGFQQTCSLKQGLEQTIAFYQELARQKNLSLAIKVKNWEG